MQFMSLPMLLKGNALGLGYRIRALWQISLFQSEEQSTIPMILSADVAWLHF